MAASLLLRPRTTIVATVRDRAHPTVMSLESLPAGDGSKIVVLILDVTKGFESLGPSLEAAGITSLNVIISNAGNSTSHTSIHDTTPQQLRDDFEINALGPFQLFQACWPLLARGQIDNRKFVLITSSVGSIAGLEQENMPGVSYGASKAAANWISKKLSVELKGEGIKVGIIHPGYVTSF